MTESKFSPTLKPGAYPYIGAILKQPSAQSFLALGKAGKQVALAVTTFPFSSSS